MYHYFVKLIKKNQGSEFFIIKYFLIPIYGILFSLIIFLIFTPLVYSKYLKFFLYYNKPFQKIDIKFPKIDSMSFNNNQIELYLSKIECMQTKDSGVRIKKFHCSKIDGQYKEITLTDFPTEINLSFPKYYEISLQTEYSFSEFLNKKNRESIALKTEIADFLQLREVKFITGNNQIYIINYDTTITEIYSIFYDFGNLYLIKYLANKNDLNDSIKFIRVVENLVNE